VQTSTFPKLIDYNNTNDNLKASAELSSLKGDLEELQNSFSESINGNLDENVHLVSSESMSSKDSASEEKLNITD